MDEINLNLSELGTQLDILNGMQNVCDSITWHFELNLYVYVLVDGQTRITTGDFAGAEARMGTAISYDKKTKQDNGKGVERMYA